MKILIIGSGGREHAIATKLAESPHQPELFFAPGNPGMAALGQRLEIDPLDLQGLLLFTQREQIGLTVVGPEAPLAAGIVDIFQKAGLPIFGPTQAGAQLEASKAYAKEIMMKAGVPTAGYRFCKTEAEALSTLAEFTPPYVIKQDGLAAGKGVTIAATDSDAKAAISEAFHHKMPVVIEEFLQGEELSILAFCDGTRAIPLIGAQDFKRAGDGNTGPNTGGMGAFAPVPFATLALIQRVQAEVFDPVLRTLQAEGIDYRGILYAGLMVTPQGEPKVIEFNARFGDPETQVVLPLLEEDLVDLMLATAQGDLSAYASQGLRFKPQAAVTVVLASGGYPGAFEKGFPITFPETLPPNTHLFHAGTKILPTQQIVTAGGRVLTATGLGSDVEKARQKAYTLASQVQFEGQYYRRDIAAMPTTALR